MRVIERIFFLPPLAPQQKRETSVPKPGERKFICRGYKAYALTQGKQISNVFKMWLLIPGGHQEMEHLKSVPFNRRVITKRFPCGHSNSPYVCCPSPIFLFSPLFHPLPYLILGLQSFPCISKTMYSISPCQEDPLLPRVPYQVPNLCSYTNCSMHLIKGLYMYMTNILHICKISKWSHLGDTMFSSKPSTVRNGLHLVELLVKEAPQKP